MLKEKEANIKRAVILLDGFIILTAFFLAYYLRQNLHSIYGWDLFPGRNLLEPAVAPLKEYLFVIFCVVPLWCLLFYYYGMYESLRIRKYHQIVWIIIKTSFLVGLIFGSIVFLFKLMFVSRILFVIFSIVSFCFILIEKSVFYLIFRSLLKRGNNLSTFLIVGTGSRAADFVKRIRSHPEWGLKILGTIDDDPSRGIQKVEGTDVIGSLDDIPDILRNNSVDEVIFIVPRSRLNYMQDSIFACETVGISTVIAVDLFDLQIAKAHVSDFDGIPLVRHQTTVGDASSLFIKRIIDIVISALLLILVLPFFIIASIIIKVTSKGPLFFRQERLGLNGRKFTLYKFRTMYLGAHEELKNGDKIDVMHKPDFKKKKLKWITPVGKFLRRISFDELPQLINILFGQMSLVGPRPTVLAEASQYKDWERRRLSVKPGLTCLWQIKGRNRLDHQEWMKLDLEYLDNWSLWLDIKILIKTIPVVFLGIGAY